VLGVLEGVLQGVLQGVAVEILEVVTAKARVAIGVVKSEAVVAVQLVAV
jgi:hypothetical protein